jgi:ligand-binding sensor domain-containing protein
MIKKLTRGIVTALIAITVLLPFNKVKAGIPVGTWRAHPAYNNATFSLKAFGKIMVLSEGAIYYYDPSDNSIYTIDKVGGLSDTDIAAIGFCKTENAVLIVYSNGNIDILYSDETIYNCTDLKNNNIGSVQINELRFIDNFAYISTNIGLVIFDVKRREIKNTYRFDSPVNSFVLINDSLFCGTDKGIYLGKTDDNLLDFSKWKMFRNIKFIDLFEFNGYLSGRSYDNKVWTINKINGGLALITTKVNAISYLNDNKLALIHDTVVSIYSDYKNYTDYSFKNTVNNLVIDNDIWWLAQGIEGLCQYKFTEENGLTVISQGIKPNSPRRNLFHSLSWPEPGRLLIVGGCHDIVYKSTLEYPGTVMIYENDKWSYLEDNLSAKTGLKYVNLTEAAQDPFDKNHIFVGSTGQGVYEFRDNKFYKLHSWNNSALKSIINDNEKNKNNYVRISALQYDNKGNLWMANNEIDTIIRVLEPNGNWFSLYYDELEGLPTFKQLRFDKKGHIWLNSSRYLPGIFCIDTKSTLKDNRDDIVRFSSSYFKNQDGTTEEIYEVYCYEFDLEGQMWIGTDKGIFVLKNPDNFISNPDPVFERIKIPRNDGSDLADYLFNGVPTTAIYIDQGNRKWIGTSDNGVFFMSEDGTETLAHFTVSNSPLPSNSILSITEDGQNGSVFFGTSLGLVEYGGQARDPEETLSKSNILVYPNPVKPDFDGYVTITGLTSESSIRITSNSGKLINQGTSNGGSYSWNLNDFNGHPVPSGVYHAVITNSENNKSESASITVIR